MPPSYEQLPTFDRLRVPATPRSKHGSAVEDYNCNAEAAFMRAEGAVGQFDPGGADLAHHLLLARAVGANRHQPAARPEHPIRVPDVLDDGPAAKRRVHHHPVE